MKVPGPPARGQRGVAEFLEATADSAGVVVAGPGPGPGSGPGPEGGAQPPRSGRRDGSLSGRDRDGAPETVVQVEPGTALAVAAPPQPAGTATLPPDIVVDMDGVGPAGDSALDSVLSPSAVPLLLGASPTAGGGGRSQVGACIWQGGWHGSHMSSAMGVVDMSHRTLAHHSVAHVLLSLWVSLLSQGPGTGAGGAAGKRPVRRGGRAPPGVVVKSAVVSPAAMRAARLYAAKLQEAEAEGV